MSSIFVDRESAYPNRYRVIPESGDAYYVVLERADEPVTPGTPLNAETFNGMREEISNEINSITPGRIGAAPASHAAKTNNPHNVTAKQVGAVPAVESTEYRGCYYRTVTDNLTKEEVIEWFNPPMTLDEEYRTTDRLGNYVIFTKFMYIGDCQNNTEITATFPGKIFSIHGYAGDYSMPMKSVPYDRNGGTISCCFEGSRVFVKPSFDDINEYFGYKIFIQAWYIKDFTLG